MLWADFGQFSLGDDGVGDITARLYEFEISTPYDVSSTRFTGDKEIVEDAGIPLT